MQGFVAFPIETVLVLDFTPSEDEGMQERGGVEVLPKGGYEISDSKVFFPGEKPFEWAVFFDGYLYGGTASCTGHELGIDGCKVFFCEF